MTEVICQEALPLAWRTPLPGSLGNLGRGWKMGALHIGGQAGGGGIGEHLPELDDPWADRDFPTARPDNYHWYTLKSGGLRAPSQPTYLIRPWNYDAATRAQKWVEALLASEQQSHANFTHSAPTTHLALQQGILRLRSGRWGPIEPAEFFDIEVCLCTAADMDEAAISALPFWINSPNLSAVASVATSALKCGGRGQQRLGGCKYTCEGIEALTGLKDLRYVNWYRRLLIPIVDSKSRIIAVLDGMPKDTTRWNVLTDHAASLMATRAQGRANALSASCRAVSLNLLGDIVAVANAHVSQEPGELHNNASNTRLTDSLLREECLQRLAGPLHARSVFAACTFNFGPHAMTLPHLDFGNLSWGWNGFQTDEAFEQLAMATDKAAHRADNVKQWEGVAMYSTVDSLLTTV
ncbi:hypothetical protein DFH06DRAFT_1130519 [Mycena polygramma]|nr:hypothetical protein DFH06DRAFT_1130519 [Mycena polygramma]